MKSPTTILADEYCRIILNRPLDFRSDGRILKQAAKLIKMAQSLGGDGQHVYACLLAIASGTTEFTHYEPYEVFAKKYRYPTPLSLDVLSWNPTLPTGQKRSDVTILQAYLEVPPEPLVYNRVDYADWVVNHGRRAARLGLWDGIYQYTVGDDPEKDLLPPEELSKILGPGLKVRALENWKHERLIRGQCES